MPHRIRTTILPLSALFVGVAALLAGSGLLGTLVGVRAAREGFTSEVLGLVMGAYFLGFMAGSFFSVQLVERAGHVRTFAALAAIASSATLGHMLVITPVAWGLFRMVAGFCFAGLYMVIESWLNERATNQNRGRVFAVYMTINLGALAAGQFLLMTADPGGFVLFCLVSILVSMALVPVVLTRAVAPVPVKVLPLTLRRMLAISPLGTVGAAVSGLILGSFWALAPVFAEHIGLTADDIAVFMGITILGGFVLQWPVGRLSDRIGRRPMIVAACFIGAGASLGVAASAGRAEPFLLGFAFLFGGVGLSHYSLSVAHVNDVIEPHDLVPAASSILLLYGTGATLGPVIAGLVMQRAGPYGLYLMFAAVFLAAGAFALYRKRRGAPIPVEAQTPFRASPRTTPLAYELDPRSAHGAESAGPAARA